MRESAIERAACRRVKARLGVGSLKLNVSGQTGWPDREFFIPGGRPLLIEFKRPGEKLTPKQVHVHLMLRELGYDVTTCWTVDEAERYVRSALERAGLFGPAAELEATRVPEACGPVARRARGRRAVP